MRRQLQSQRTAVNILHPLNNAYHSGGATAECLAVKPDGRFNVGKYYLLQYITQLITQACITHITTYMPKPVAD